MRFPVAVLLSLGLLGLFANPVAAIEAVRGKDYQLTTKHGPWMIMVSSFRDIHDPSRKDEGLTALEAARELVYELRANKIPAYMYAQNGEVANIDTVDRLGRPEQRVYAAQRDMICVLAGNYESADDKNAKDTLKYIKAFYPKFLKQEGNGGVFRLSPGRQGPLAGAFLTINPMLKPNEVMARKPDDVVLALNSGIEHALVSADRNSKYTLVISTMTGRSVTPHGISKFRNREEEFDQSLLRSTDATKHNGQQGMNDIGEAAMQLTRALRAQGVEAYVYHDRFKSIVTVGGFTAPDDPRIAPLYEKYCAKSQTDKATGVAALIPETYALDIRGGRQIWSFDASPRLIPIPRVK